MTDKEEKLKEEAVEELRDSGDKLHGISKEVHIASEELAELIQEGPEVEDENNLDEAFKDEIKEVERQLLRSIQDTLDVMKQLNKLRQGKTPFFAPGTPEQDVAMAAISGNKAAGRFRRRYISWPLNDFEDWDEIDRNLDYDPRNGQYYKVQVEGTTAYRTSGPCGTTYYLVEDKTTYEPV